MELSRSWWNFDMGLFTKKNNIEYENLIGSHINGDCKEWISQYHYDEIDL